MIPITTLRIAAFVEQASSAQWDKHTKQPLLVALAPLTISKARTPQANLAHHKFSCFLIVLCILCLQELLNQLFSIFPHTLPN